MSKSLLKSTTIVSSMTLISRILGFIRDMVAAHLFGASLGYDAFLTAFKIPNFMRRLFAEGAFSQAFVPVLAEYTSTKQMPDTKDFIGKVAGSLSFILIGVTLLGMLLSPLFILIFAPGFYWDPDRFALASDMLRITFPYLLFISLTAFSGGVLNTFGKFAVPSFTPVFLNLSMISAALFLSPKLGSPIVALAWGVLLGGFVQLIFQIPYLFKYKLLPKPKVDFNDPGVKKVLRLMVPALFGVSVNQINLILDTAFASFLPIGSISWLYYSDRLMEFPLGVFGVALATVVLPHLSKRHSENSNQAYKQTLDWALRWVLLIGLPAALGLFFLSGPLLTTLFQYGRFTGHDVGMARYSLMAYALGLLGFILVKVLASAYYAKQDMKTPVKIALITMLMNIVLNSLFIKPFAHTGLAMATAMAALLNAALLMRGLIKRKFYEFQQGWPVFALRCLCANMVMILFLLFETPKLHHWLDWEALSRITHLFPIIITAGLLYIATLWMTGVRPRHVLVQTS